MPGENIAGVPLWQRAEFSPPLCTASRSTRTPRPRLGMRDSSKRRRWIFDEGPKVSGGLPLVEPEDATRCGGVAELADRRYAMMLSGKWM